MKGAVKSKEQVTSFKDDFSVVILITLKFFSRDFT